MTSIIMTSNYLTAALIRIKDENNNNIGKNRKKNNNKMKKIYEVSIYSVVGMIRYGQMWQVAGLINTQNQVSRQVVNKQNSEVNKMRGIGVRKRYRNKNIGGIKVRK